MHPLHTLSSLRSRTYEPLGAGTAAEHTMSKPNQHTVDTLTTTNTVQVWRDKLQREER